MDILTKPLIGGKMTQKGATDAKADEPQSEQEELSKRREESEFKEHEGEAHAWRLASIGDVLRASEGLAFAGRRVGIEPAARHDQAAFRDRLRTVHWVSAGLQPRESGSMYARAADVREIVVHNVDDRR